MSSRKHTMTSTKDTMSSRKDTITSRKDTMSLKILKKMKFLIMQYYTHFKDKKTLVFYGIFFL